MITTATNYQPTRNDPRDLGDPDLYTTTDRHQRWENFAAEDRVHWSAPGFSPTGFWSVFSHETCSRLLAPQAPFTSEYGMMIGFDKDHPDRSGGSMLVVTDGTRHTQLRQLVGRFLSRAKAASLRSFIESETRELLASARNSPTVDVAAKIGPTIPAGAVCEILGVPVEDREYLISLTNHAFAGADTSFDEMTPSEAHSEILLYFDDLIQERREALGDDLISAMLQDPGLDPDEVLLNCDNVLIGGNETTRHAISGAFHASAVEPTLLPALLHAPEQATVAIDELIRWTSPAAHVLRVATADVVLAGQHITEGSAVAAWLPAANRDPRVFENPHRFQPNRRPNRHLAFGIGAHHCLGAALARVELEILLRVMSETIRAVELPAQPTWLRSNLVQGYRHLEVEVTWQ